ncbi:MAG: cobaltochelatase subunit CobN, partial [Gammaproteobacteria bacterium]|nr:cobaltochelatase subunit CobN [Gammaproteobacteria bacterium]
MEYPSEENFKRLIVFLGVKFCNVDAEILPPISRPVYGIYHPYAPEIFTNTTDYLEWYGSTGQYDQSNPTVGIITTSYKRMERDSALLDALIESFESRNVNVILSTYAYKDPNSIEYLMENGRSVVDSVIIISRGSPLSYKNSSKGIADLQKLNVTALNGIRLFYGMTQEEWEASPHGIPPIQTYQVALAELDGIIEPIVICGKAIDPVTMIEYNKPIDYQIDWLTDRTVSWMRLHRMNNSDKKIVIPYYSAGGGKANIGSDIDYYLDTQASLTNLLAAMADRGYDLGNEPLPNKTELTELMMHQGSNFGTWAPGELEKRVKQGNIILIPKSKYLEWFGELPVDKQDEMIKHWGNPPGEIMVYKNESGEYLVIPKIQFGNLLLAPDPTWGWLQNDSVMYYDASIPPTHQCLAFYLWLNKEFDADAIFAIFTGIEMMPGKECGLSAHDWGAILLQEMPLIHVLPMDAEGIFDRRRANMLIVDFMTPTIVPSGLYGNLSNLQQLIGLHDQAVSEVVKEKYKTTILAECQNLSLDRDLEVDLNVIGSNATEFKGFLIRLSKYLQELKSEYMPYGSHILSEPPINESMIALVEAMLGDEFKNNVSAINSSDGATTLLLIEVLLNGSDLDAAQNDILGSVSEGVTCDLNHAIEYANRISACTIEIPRILDALEGKYIPPGSNGDPVRNPDALPTGRNLCTFDERLIPTKEAWEVGKDLTDQLLMQHVNETGDCPQKVAFLLWSIETSRHQGTMESEIFYLLGVKPFWNSKLRVTDVELINSSDLGRPRIDVVVTTSGSYRDMYSSKVKLIDKAVRLAALANDTEYPNYVNISSELIYQGLNATGNYTSEEARYLSMTRIFSPPPDSYTTGLQNAIPAGNTWNDTEKLANLYINRMSYVYGGDIWGEQYNDLFKQNLDGVEICVFSRSSNVYGVLDHPEVAAYFGGLSMAVKSVSGNAPDMYINNLREPNAAIVETLEHFFNRELRTRYFNPKWIKGMMEHDYDGTRYMAQFTEDLWMWNVVTPDLVTDDIWKQVYDIYVKDPDMKDFFESNNPYAYQSITAQMLEAARKL